MSRKTKTLLRTVFLGATILNQAASSSGALIGCFTNDTAITIYNIASAALTAVASFMAWWFNNSVTEAAQLADEYLDKIKEEKKKERECK